VLFVGHGLIRIIFLEHLQNVINNDDKLKGHPYRCDRTLPQLITAELLDLILLNDLYD
jgi:hypothetical protein